MQKTRSVTRPEVEFALLPFFFEQKDAQILAAIKIINLGRYRLYCLWLGFNTRNTNPVTLSLLSINSDSIDKDIDYCCCFDVTLVPVCTPPEVLQWNATS